MRLAAEGTGIEVVSLATRYPSGGERQLIALLTGTQVPDDRLPQDLGILCLNVGTLYALERALGHGEPLVSRIVTVAGGACRNPGNYRIPFGTPIAHLLAAADCQARDCAGLVLGGAMMGEPLEDPQVPVTPTAHCVLALTAAELPPPQSRPCIRCGLCATACPVALLPQQLHRYALVGNHRELERHHLSACIECGACNYVCPSGIPLARQFRTAKAELEAWHTARRQADRDRQRFAAHRARRTAEARARDSRYAALANSESPPENRALDLARLAMARAASPRANHHQALQRTAMAAADRVRRLEIQFDQLPPDTGTQQRKALLARVEQARIDHREAQRRLAESEVPAQAPPPAGNPE
jgi:electron transport complex protein RnfC